MQRNGTVVFLVLVSGILLMGCRKPVHFPSQSLGEQAKLQRALRAYDPDRDGKADFFMYANAAGRIDRIAYDRDGDEKPDEMVSLDAVGFQDSRHLVIILDGFGYDVVKGFYDSGFLRVFHPPSRVIAPYPTMTDMAIEDIFGYIPCPGFEAMYFDREANKLVGGSWAYLRGKNQPYNRLLQYRANLIWDVIGYIAPWKVFGKEINDIKRIFDKRLTREVRGYLVSSAGVSTEMGADGQRRCLVRVEQLVNQILWETRGLAKVTLLSDHGHSYTRARRIPLEEHLKENGWRLTKKLRRPRDVVYIRFGLETYASFATKDSPALAKTLIGCQGVELVSYTDSDTVVVLGRNGARAVITRVGDRYSYQPVTGDALKLKNILTTLQADENGCYDPDELLTATATHVYPAPLRRLWRAHFGLVENPPDVIVSLEDRFYSGAKWFAGSVKVTSTHGGLNYKNSATVIMSTIGPLPEVMRSSDIPKHMRELIGRE